MEDPAVSEDEVGAAAGSSAPPSGSDAGPSASTSTLPPDAPCYNDQSLPGKEVGFAMTTEPSSSAQNNNNANNQSQKNKVAKSASLDHDTKMMRVEAEIPQHMVITFLLTISAPAGVFFYNTKLWFFHICLLLASSLTRSKGLFY